MKIGKLFNQLPKEDYLRLIENHKEYSDFNTLGLYRSLLENGTLSLEDQLEIREFAHGYFKKTFEFLQLKDPVTYFGVSTLGEKLTQGDEQNHWRIIRENQQKILKDKKISHRNFGKYSIHNCGYDHCPMNGLMIRQGSPFAESSIHFKSDESRFSKKEKVNRQKKDRRKWKENKRKWED